MAVRPQVAGKTLVKVALPSGGSLSDVGYTRNGADVSEQPFFLPIPGDENGGDSGPPIDIQYLGEVVQISLEFTTFDADVVESIRAFVAGATAGTPAEVGTLMFQDDKAARLVLANSNAPQNFPRVVFQEPIVRNVGSRFSICRLTATAYKNASGVLWNETVS